MIPLFPIFGSYSLINLLVELDIYNLVIVASALIASVGSIKLA